MLHIHLRGIHYLLLGRPEADGASHTNTEVDRLWVQGKGGQGRQVARVNPVRQDTDEWNTPRSCGSSMRLVCLTRLSIV
jgi:hypothetical protein